MTHLNASLQKNRLKKLKLKPAMQKRVIQHLQSSSIVRMGKRVQPSPQVCMSPARTQRNGSNGAPSTETHRIRLVITSKPLFQDVLGLKPAMVMWLPWCVAILFQVMGVCYVLILIAAPW